MANFAGSTDYASTTGSPVKFAIAKATPIVTVSDAGGQSTGAAYPATARLTAWQSGRGQPDVYLLQRKHGHRNPAYWCAKRSTGTYTVVANFGGSADYNAAASSPVTFDIGSLPVPTVTVIDAGGPFTGSTYPAVAQVNGVASLENVTPTLAYYSGSTATGTPLAAAPSAVGTYTVVANFAGSGLREYNK